MHRLSRTTSPTGKESVGHCRPGWQRERNAAQICRCCWSAAWNQRWRRYCHYCWSFASSFWKKRSVRKLFLQIFISVLGDDILTKIQISLAESLLGFRRKLKTLSGRDVAIVMRPGECVHHNGKKVRYWARIEQNFQAEKKSQTRACRSPAALESSEILSSISTWRKSILRGCAILKFENEFGKLFRELKIKVGNLHIQA